jgi:hypothetical protein
MQKQEPNDYRELLAKERSDRERAFVLKVLERMEAENRLRKTRGWIVVRADQTDPSDRSQPGDGLTGRVPE